MPTLWRHGHMISHEGAAADQRAAAGRKRRQARRSNDSTVLFPNRGVAMERRALKRGGRDAMARMRR